MAIIQGFNVPDEVLAGMRERNEMAKVCSGCGMAMGAVRDIHKDWYCSNCLPKVSKLGRYKNALYNPTVEERKAIFENFKRAGGR